MKRGNWIQTDPKKGWFTILRLYSPLPSFFDKSWRPSEIELAGASGGKASGTMIQKIEKKIEERMDKN